MDELQPILLEILAALIGPETAPLLAELVSKTIADLKVLPGAYQSAGAWAVAAGLLSLLIKGYRSTKLQVFTRRLAMRYTWARYLVWENLPTAARVAVPLGLGAFWAAATGLGGLMSWPGAVVSGLLLGGGAIFAHHGGEKSAALARAVGAAVTRRSSLQPKLDPSKVPPPKE